MRASKTFEASRHGFTHKYASACPHVHSPSSLSGGPCSNMLISLISAIDCLALSVFLYTLFAFRSHRRRRGFPYPPGPPSWPVIGNLLDVPNLSPWIAYANMSKKYGRSGLSCLFLNLVSRLLGDVVCFQVFGQVIVILCSQTAIKDLIEKRGELYSDRITFPIFEMLDCSLALLRCSR